MKFTFDMYKNLKQSKVFLANPTKKYIGTLSSVKNMELLLKFNDISEATFIIHEKENGELVDHYDKIENKRLVEVQFVGWFVITNVNEVNDGVDNYKEVKCSTLEYELIGKRIDDLNGVFALYDFENPDKSIMHIVTQDSGWNIGHIDNELLSKFRTFAIDTSKIYNFLMTDVSKSFECVFVYNTYDKSINVYKLSNIGKLTDIVVSYKNILKQYVRSSSGDKIITKLKVVGADNLDIRATNPTGTNFLINLDYFMTLEWASQSLIDAWNTYKTKYGNVLSAYTSTLSLIKSQQAELTILEAQLATINGEKKINETVQGTYVSNGIPAVGTPEYILYLNATNAIATSITQKVLKETDITNKKSQIAITQVSLDDISTDLDMSTNFTSAQITEMIPFITENEEYSDSTFAITDTMTREETIDMQMELMQNASNELDRASKPQFTVDITANNLFAIKDDSGSTTYEKMREDCETGNLLTIKFGNGNWTTARLVSLGIKFDNLSDIDLVFSDKSRFDGELIQLGGLLANAGRTASTLSLAKMGYDAASKITSQVREFINGTLDTTLNAMQSNDNQELLIDAYGLHMRKWLPDQNKYDDHQAWWNNNTLLFSDDGWHSAKTGIGLFTTTSGEKIYSVFADVIAGNLIMGEKLNISNTSGTYTINNNGFTASTTVGANTYSAGINPSTPDEIINVKINGTNKFFVDTANNRIVMRGRIEAESGTLASLTVTGTLTGGTISGSTISAASITGGTISGSTITSSTFISTGANGRLEIVGSDISGYNSTGGLVLWITADGNINAGSVSAVDLYCTRINSGTPITSSNIDYQSVSYADTAGSVSNLSTDDIYASDTGYGNIDFLGFDNAAGVNWAQATFETKTTSDFRLKCNMKSLDDIPDDLFYSLKPYQYNYKPETTYRKGIFFGLIAQEVESAFKSFGLNPYDYDLIEVMDVNKYTDDGFYINDGTHRLNDKNLIGWLIKIVQTQNNRIISLENIINS